MGKRVQRFQQGQHELGSKVTQINEAQRNIRNEIAGEEIVQILRKLLMGLKQAGPTC